MARIELFYDIVSPYSWFAFETLGRYQERWGLDLVLRPFLLGGVMRATDNRPPTSVPAKRSYIQKDLARSAAYFGVPLRPPSASVSLDTLRPMRLLTVVAMHGPELLEPLTRALWQEHWRNGGDTSEDAVLRGSMVRAGIPEERVGPLLERVQDPATKEALRAATDEAVHRGAFGAPTLFVQAPRGEEMFFGSDRFPLVARCLGLEWHGPVPGRPAETGGAPPAG